VTHPLKIIALVVLKSTGLPNGPKRSHFYTKDVDTSSEYY